MKTGKSFMITDQSQICTLNVPEWIQDMKRLSLSLRLVTLVLMANRFHDMSSVFVSHFTPVSTKCSQCDFSSHYARILSTDCEHSIVFQTSSQQIQLNCEHSTATPQWPLVLPFVSIRILHRSDSLLMTNQFGIISHLSIVDKPSRI